MEEHQRSQMPELRAGSEPPRAESTRGVERTLEGEGRAASSIHSHDYSAPLALSVGESRRVRAVLSALVIPLLIATVVGMVLLWPTTSGEGGTLGSQPFVAEGASLERARITSLDVSECNAVLQSTGAGAGGLLADAVCAEILSGDGMGLTVAVHIPAESLTAARVGDELSVMYAPQALASGTPYVFVDYVRQVPILALSIVYLVVVLAVAGRKGLRSVVGLVVATAVLLRFMIPAFLALESPLWVTLVGAMGMMLAAVYIAHGISVRTTTALLGTMAGVAITVGLSLWGVPASKLTGALSEEATTLAALVPGINLQTLLTCGMVIAALGVLNDVTITQASAVWELYAANPRLSRGRLLTGGMRIGADHIASTVYTLAFAYAGTALPLILAAALIDRSLAQQLMSGEIAEEIVRTLISSIGLVLAIPATTAIAAALCAPARSSVSDEE